MLGDDIPDREIDPPEDDYRYGQTNHWSEEEDRPFYEYG